MPRQVLKRRTAPDLIYDHHPGQPGAPTLLFLSGYRSDRTGSKATAFAAWAKTTPFGYIRFDYSGHGESGGTFRDLTLSDWIQDTDDILTHVAPSGPVILIGSSMGGWVALALALRHPTRIKGIIGIAAAPDFTTKFEQSLSPDQRAEMIQNGFVTLGSTLGPDPYIITQKLLNDGKNNQILNKTHDLAIPMTLFQGGNDPAVAPDTPLHIARAFPKAAIKITMIPDGDHGLSRPEDLSKMYEAVIQLTVIK